MVFSGFVSIYREVLRDHHNWRENLVVKIHLRKSEFHIYFKVTSLIRKLAWATREKKKTGKTASQELILLFHSSVF